MALGQNIRRRRKDQGLTLEQLSDLSGVEVGTISAIENRDSARSKYATALARALGVSMEQLERDQTEPPVCEVVSPSVYPLMTPEQRREVRELLHISRKLCADQLTQLVVFARFLTKKENSKAPPKIGTK